MRKEKIKIRRVELGTDHKITAVIIMKIEVSLLTILASIDKFLDVNASSKFIFFTFAEVIIWETSISFKCFIKRFKYQDTKLIHP